MAQRVITVLTDDLDGSEANETIDFSIDDVGYSIDLNEVHASELRKILDPYISSGRRVAGRKSKAAAPRGAKPSAKEIREWAASKGIDMNSRGRLHADVVEKYLAAH